MFGDTPPTVIAVDPALRPADMAEQVREQLLRQPTWFAVAGDVRTFDPEGDLDRAKQVQKAVPDIELPIFDRKPGNWPRNGIACINTANDEFGQAWPLGGVAPLRAGVALCMELGTTRLRIWTHHDSHFLEEGDKMAIEMAWKHGVEFRVESPLLKKTP